MTCGNDIFEVQVTFQLWSGREDWATCKEHLIRKDKTSTQLSLLDGKMKPN